MENLKKKFLAKVNKKTGNVMTENTANQYIRYLKNIHGGEFKNLSWVKDTEKVLATINEKYAESTRASALNALSVACEVSRGYKKIGQFYKSKFQSAIAPINEQRNTGEKTEKEKEYWISWDDIIKRRDELEGLDRVILSLYTWLPPRRAKDFGTMEINSQTGNSFEPRTQRFLFRDYKTAGTYGEQVVDVPDDLYIELMDWLKGRDTGKLLPISTVSITKHLNAIFKPKKISVSALRHIYDTHHFGETKKRMKDTARLMAHSSAQQQQYIKG
jgi:integrase